MRRHAALPFLILGVVFYTIGISGQRGFIAIGTAFLAIGVAFLLRQRRARKSR
jgi:hypothetical protein